MRRFEPSLMRLLIIKGACRTGPPVYVLWSIFEWSRIDWRMALAFAALTINYVIVYLLTWTAPSLMNGPWRVRAWQTLVLLLNVFALPIAYHRTFGGLPWLFFAATLLCFASLYIGTVIYLRLHDKLPQGFFGPQLHRAAPPPAQVQAARTSPEAGLPST